MGLLDKVPETKEELKQYFLYKLLSDYEMNRLKSSDLFEQFFLFAKGVIISEHIENENTKRK